MLFTKNAPHLLSIRTKSDNSLPLAPLPHKKKAVSRRMPRAVREGISILVADDEPAILQTAASILRRQGYNVLAARDGHAALTAFEQAPRAIHLVISDVMMPGVTGPQLVRTVRRASPSIATLLMSGTPGVAPHGVSSMRKPFTVSGLVATVESLLAECDFAEIDREQSAKKSRKLAAAVGLDAQPIRPAAKNQRTRPD
jgi:CheY-like chemotaxis protein